MKWIISNHKIDLGKEEVIDYEKELSKIVTNNKLVICPKSSYLEIFKGTNYELGSRNVDDCILVEDLKKLGVKYTIVAHSERDDSVGKINHDLNSLLEYDITPILCVGEEKKSEEKIIFEQLDYYLESIKDPSKIMIAYEPIWAIGTGEIPTKEKLESIITRIKEYMSDKYNSNNLILYGGSVGLDNINLLKDIPIVDGYLLGGTSLDIEKLKIFVKEME